MKLDRNIGPAGPGKYRLLKMREWPTDPDLDGEAFDALQVLDRAGLVDIGVAGSESEFFVIRLKDKYAMPALIAYADAAMADDAEWAGEVRELAARSGPAHPNCKRPD